MASANRWGRRRKMTGPLISTRAEGAVRRKASLSGRTAADLARFVARVAAQTGVPEEEIEVRTLDLALSAFLRRDQLFRSMLREKSPPVR